MIIVITRPDFFEGEAEKIAQLLQSGRADLVHIRKPRASQSEVEQLLFSIPTSSTRVWYYTIITRWPSSMACEGCILTVVTPSRQQGGVGQ